MYIIIGLIRSSVLYAFILSAICGSFSMDFFLYLRGIHFLGFSDE